MMRGTARLPALLLLIGTHLLGYSSAFMVTPFLRSNTRLHPVAGGRVQERRGYVGRETACPLRMTVTDPRQASPVSLAGERDVCRYYDTTLRDGAQGEGISLVIVFLSFLFLGANLFGLLILLIACF